MQTHVAENRAEVRWVGELFPEARSYLDVYAPPRPAAPARVLAHGIWLDDRRPRALRDSGAQIAFCPSSNLFLGSGLFDWPARARRRAGVSVASDVGGGTSLSMQRTLADGYKVQALARPRLNAWCALHAATRGAAQALGLATRSAPGARPPWPTWCIWDWAVGPVDGHRQQLGARPAREGLCLDDAGRRAPPGGEPGWPAGPCATTKGPHDHALRLELSGISKQYPAVRANDGVACASSPARSTPCWARTAPARAR
jgi:guanine deaminase